MSELVDVTNRIIDDDHTAAYLKLADDYCLSYRRMKDTFVLPRDHAWLKVIIETYANRPEAFAQYVKVVRDAVVDSYRGDPKAADVQELYRSLVVRMAQASLRERRRQATAWFEQQYPKADTQHKHQWMRRLEQRWAKQRRAALSAARRQAGGRLSMAEVSSITEDFWKCVDKEIAEGHLPPLE